MSLKTTVLVLGCNPSFISYPLAIDFKDLGDSIQISKGSSEILTNSFAVELAKINFSFLNN
jgi:hypothetical protein